MAAASAVSQEPSGNLLSQTAVGEPDVDPTWSESVRIANRLRDKCFSEGLPMSIPAEISSKKSWSSVYKESEAYRIAIKIRETQQAIDDALHGDPLTRMSALSKIAKKLGVDV